MQTNKLRIAFFFLVLLAGRAAGAGIASAGAAPEAGRPASGLLSSGGFAVANPASGKTAGGPGTSSAGPVLFGLETPLTAVAPAGGPEPPLAAPVPLADPFILLSGDTYYAYGTHSDRGIEVYTSDDLLTWTPRGLALDKRDVWGDRWFWAPEVYALGGRFYMYYSADEHISAAVADSPLGPFRQTVKAPMLPGEKSIDNSLFIDDDGQAYLFFVRFNDGNNIWVARLADDFVTLRPETMRPCLHVSQPWEEVWPRVNEGPYVVKHDGLYYMTYSANSYESPLYGIGCATADNPMGPWTKYADNPLLQRPGDLYGTGHHALFTDKEGQGRIVFHAHRDSAHIHPRAMHIGWVRFDKTDGADRLQISSDYVTPCLAEKASAEGASAGSAAAASAWAASGPAVYRNPVVPYSLPDPSVIRADDGYFYLYATEDIHNLPIHRSKDLVHWEQIATAFTDRGRPDFEPGAGIWAPDINRIGDRYVLYYSLSVWGGEWTCGIGCATSDRPEGPFKDEGMMMRSNQIGVRNSIDPFYIEEGGKKYLFWGSFRGIYGIRLTDDGLRVAEGEKPCRVAGTAYEGTYIHKRDGYYYLFASTGTCCEGLKSTYATVVGRSKSLFGPYVDKAGRPMLDNRHEILIAGNAAFVGTGHNSEIVADEAGRDWLFYHAVDTGRPEGRVLMLDRVDWTDGWPSVAGGTPSLEAEAPAFGRGAGE